MRLEARDLDCAPGLRAEANGIGELGVRTARSDNTGAGDTLPP